MANPHKGEFECALSGKVYRFRFGTDALAEMQELLSPPGEVLDIDTMLRDVLRRRVKYIKAFLWASLRCYHPEVSLSDMADLLDNSEPSEIEALVAELGLTAVPDKKDLEALTDGQRPQKAQATKRRRGTGASSTSTHAVSA